MAIKKYSSKVHKARQACAQRGVLLIRKFANGLLSKSAGKPLHHANCGYYRTVREQHCVCKDIARQVNRNGMRETEAFCMAKGRCVVPKVEEKQTLANMRKVCNGLKSKISVKNFEIYDLKHENKELKMKLSSLGSLEFDLRKCKNSLNEAELSISKLLKQLEMEKSKQIQIFEKQQQMLEFYYMTQEDILSRAHFSRTQEDSKINESMEGMLNQQQLSSEGTDMTDGLPDYVVCLDELEKETHGFAQEQKALQLNESKETSKEIMQVQQALCFVNPNLENNEGTNAKSGMALVVPAELEANFVFTRIKYADLMNAKEDIQNLMSNFIMEATKVYENPHPIEMRVLWMVNSITLLKQLSQYDNVKESAKKQRKNFDLCNFKELVSKMYCALVIQQQTSLKSLVISAMLGGDTAHDMTISPFALPARKNTEINGEKHFLLELEHFHKLIQSNGLDDCFVDQIFHQLMYFICACTLNTLMVRSELCTRPTRMIIEYNLKSIEDWIGKKQISNNVLITLGPLRQVAQLLKARENGEEVQYISKFCTALNTAQVLHIMESYDPYEYKSEETLKFLKALMLQKNSFSTAKMAHLTMDVSYIRPLAFPKINLEVLN